MKQKKMFKSEWREVDSVSQNIRESLQEWWIEAADDYGVDTYTEAVYCHVNADDKGVVWVDVEVLDSPKKVIPPEDGEKAIKWLAQNKIETGGEMSFKCSSQEVAEEICKEMNGDINSEEILRR